MSNSTVRWEPIDHLINDNLTELQVDNIAVTIGHGDTALATFAWPDDGQYAVCRAVPVDAPRPDWSQAPEWAHYWAMDNTGATFWYQTEPTIYQGEGWCEGGRSKLDQMAGHGWRSSLKQRPDEGWDYTDVPSDCTGEVGNV